MGYPIRGMGGVALDVKTSGEACINSSTALDRLTTVPPEPNCVVPKLLTKRNSAEALLQ
jgi:hypothetical protein